MKENMGEELEQITIVLDPLEKKNEMIHPYCLLASQHLLLRIQNFCEHMLTLYHNKLIQHE